MQGLAQDKLLLVGESFDETKLVPVWQETNNANSLLAFYLAKLILCYLLQDYSQAVANGKKGFQYISATSGTMCFSSYHFYYALAIIAEYSQQSDFAAAYLPQVILYQQQILQWASHSPTNYRHKYELLTAEIARVKGNLTKAAEHYDLAISGASAGGYDFESALAAELAGEFYLTWNKERIARLYLADANLEYQRWGALAKVAELQTKHERLLSAYLALEYSCTLEEKPSDSEQAIDSSLTEREENLLAELDLYSIVKASQAISSEIVLDNLLSKMMEIVMENTGAQKSILCLQQNSSLIVAACATVFPKPKIELPQIPLSSHSEIPKTIINYVRSTSKTVILGQSERDDIFAKDPYIVEHQMISVLSMPIIYKNQLQGIVYLENTSIENAFTAEKLDILQVLLSQVSISIENARLYKNLEDHASVQKSLQQKEILLKEIHHRVKNNLLVVSSLLEMQSSHIEEPEITKLLENCQNRVTSMALVHQHLYGSSELDRIDFAQYIISLLENLAYAQGCAERNIILHQDIDAIELNIETANPCGLIINELISNSLEHGFVNRSGGNIWLELKRCDNEQISLIVRDDGDGFPEHVDLYNSDSLGLELVCTLVEQIDGAIALDRIDGTKIEIIFNELDYQSRI